MTLKELLNSVEFDNVFNILKQSKQLDRNRKSLYDAYKHAFNELKNIDVTSNNDYKICLNLVFDYDWGDDPYIHFELKDKNGELWGLDFTPWSECVNAELEFDSEVDKLSLEEKCAELLRELTFYGFSQNDINKLKQKFGLS